jgi:hypothetical protein
VSQRSCGALRLQLELDGVVVGGCTALLNSAKHTPTSKHVDDVVAAARTLSAMLAGRDGGDLTTKPPGLVGTLAGVSRVVPFLSGNNFSAEVEDACRRQGVGVVRPSGEGFAVVAAAAAAATVTGHS